MAARTIISVVTLQMSARKNELKSTLLLTLFTVFLLRAASAAVSDGDASSPHHDASCPTSGVETHCKTCSASHRPSVDTGIYVNQCCHDVEVYSMCRDELETQSKSVVRRSIQDDLQLLQDGDIDEEKRRGPFLGKRANPFLGKRANPFLGKRRVNPFLGKRRGPFLGKRTPQDLEEILAEKRRLPFLG